MLRPKFNDYPRWVGAVRWLWRQDECAPDGERIEAAWYRLFGAPLPPQHVGSVYDAAVGVWCSVVGAAWQAMWAAVYDGGDCVYRVTFDGRVWYYGYDGGGVGLVTGPCDLVR